MKAGTNKKKTLIPNTSPRKMPTKKAIQEHWASWLVENGKFDSRFEVMEADYCFACGMLSNTERAHILARVKGGSDGVENLHNLCQHCHKTSEYLSGDVYFDWVKRWSFWDLAEVVTNKFKAKYPIQFKMIQEEHSKTGVLDVMKVMEYCDDR